MEHRGESPITISPLTLLEGARPAQAITGRRADPSPALDPESAGAPALAATEQPVHLAGHPSAASTQRSPSHQPRGTWAATAGFGNPFIGEVSTARCQLAPIQRGQADAHGDRLQSSRRKLLPWSNPITQCAQGWVCPGKGIPALQASSSLHSCQPTQLPESPPSRSADRSCPELSGSPPSLQGSTDGWRFCPTWATWSTLPFPHCKAGGEGGVG